MTSLNDRMEKTILNTKNRLNGVRTNRATPDFLNQIKVDCYGSLMPLQQLCSVTITEGRIFLLNVFDKN